MDLRFAYKTAFIKECFTNMSFAQLCTAADKKLFAVNEQFIRKRLTLNKT